MEKEKLVYSNKWLLEYVYKESDKLLRKVTDTSKFEARCIKALGEYLSLSEGNKHNKKYLVKLVKRKVKEAEDISKKEEAKIMSELLEVDDSGEETEFEPIDVLADVESEVIAKEMTALLAQDGRRKTVLDAWLVGNTNGKQISRLLAQSFGGKPETHRKFVQRFEKECQQRLTAVI